MEAHEEKEARDTGQLLSRRKTSATVMKGNLDQRHFRGVQGPPGTEEEHGDHSRGETGVPPRILPGSEVLTQSFLIWKRLSIMFLG